MIPTIYTLNPNQKMPLADRIQSARLSRARRVERRIEVRAAQVFEKHPHFQGRSQFVGIRCTGDRLILEGSLPSFYLKQLAQEAMHELMQDDQGVLVENRIVVASPCGEIGPGERPQNSKTEY